MTAEAHIDCRTPDEIAVSLIDTIINSARLLRRHYHQELANSEGLAALVDLNDDEDLSWLLERAGLAWDEYCAERTWEDHGALVIFSEEQS